MRRRQRLSFVLVATVAFVTPASASADPPHPPSDRISAGWLVIAASVAAGAILTGVSLSLSCASGDLDCARWTSLGIWGGLGIASAGTAAGVLVIKADARAARARLSFAVDWSQPGVAMPRAAFEVTF